MKRHLFIASLLGAGLLAGAAFSSDDCYAPMSTWQPREAVAEKARSMGWTVDRIRTDDGCYKVYAHDADGRRIKAKFDPADLDLIELKDDDKGRDHGKPDDEDKP